MDDMKVISGTTSVYASHEMKESFKQANAYPIAWEVIFQNDREGKTFAKDLRKAFSTLPDQMGYMLDKEQPVNEPIRCVECVFKDRDSLRRIVNEVFKERSFIDESTGQVVPKISLLSDAARLIQNQTARVAS